MILAGHLCGPQDAWDVAYYELWDDPTKTTTWICVPFLSTHHSESDVSPVVAGYVNYDLAQQYSGQTPGQFNHTSVLLAQSAVLANGGWLVSRGDGAAMLCNEYFPNRNLQASAELVAGCGPLSPLLRWRTRSLLRDGVQQGIRFDVFW